MATQSSRKRAANVGHHTLGRLVTLDDGTTAFLPSNAISDGLDPDAIAAVTNEQPILDAYGLVTRPVLPITAFGDVRVAELRPIVQIDAVYGIASRVDTFVNDTGAATNGNSLFRASTGTGANAFGSIQSKRQGKYRPGQGLTARWSAGYGTPQPDSDLISGLQSNTDTLGFGYFDDVFGIIYRSLGESDIRELIISTPASGAENATVTVNGTGYTVPLTAGTVQHNAHEIADSLNAQVPIWDFSATDDHVVSRSLLAQVAGGFAFSSATAVAAWSTVQAGAAAANGFIAQADWDNPVNLDLAGGVLNVFEARIQYLGAGDLYLFVEDRMSGGAELVHTIRRPGLFTTPSFGNPTFRLGWSASNRGNTTNVELSGASGAIFNEGPIVVTEQPRAVTSTAALVGINLVNILTIRNRLVFGTKRNRAEMLLKVLSGITDSTKGVTLQLITGAVFSGDLHYEYVDKDNSTAEFATDFLLVTGGTVLNSMVVSTLGNSLDLSLFESFLLAGEVLTVAGAVVATPASSITASLVSVEDL